MKNEIEIRCKRKACNRLLMKYYVTGKNVELNLEGFEMKCEKCKRIVQFKKYTEQSLIHQSLDGVFRI